MRTFSPTGALLTLVVASASLRAVAASASLRDVCGWPSLYANGFFGPPTVRLAQRMLSHVLNDPAIVADGKFTNATIASITEFQKRAGMGNASTGTLRSETWRKVVDACVGSPLARSPQLILAIQDGLTINGFATALTGDLDRKTMESLSAFQLHRGLLPQPPGVIADADTWHMLVTGCRGGRLGGAFWFDAGWPQGNMGVTTLACLRGHDFQYATFECWVERSSAGAHRSHEGSFWSDCPQNVANAHAAGFERVGVYMFPGRNGNPTAQAQWLLSNLSAHSVTYDAVMLDVEGDDWLQHSQEDNRAFILAIKSVLDKASVPYTVYSGRKWPAFFGDQFTAFRDAPLIYAHYDRCPSFYDFDASPKYGGWESASGKQFWDGQGDENQLCGTGALDWDWSPEPFWHRGQRVR